MAQSICIRPEGEICSARLPGYHDLPRMVEAQMQRAQWLAILLSSEESEALLQLDVRLGGCGRIWEMTVDFWWFVVSRYS